MSVVGNIIRKDLYRLRWILVLWVVVLAAGVALATLQVGLDEVTHLPFHVGAVLLASVLAPLIGFGLVMGLVHDDPVADIDAFWITRPISNRQLLCAKSGALALFCFVPVLALLPWWLCNGYTAAQVAAAGAQTLLVQLIVVALAAPLALISPNGSKFVMHVLLAGGAFLVLVLLHGLGTNRHAAFSAGLVQTRTGALVVLWLTSTAIVAGNQFFGRHTRRSWVVLAVATALGFAVTKWWAWEIRDASATGSPSAAPVTWKLAPATLPSPSGDGQKVRLGASVSGLSDHAVAVVETWQPRLQWADAAVTGTTATTTSDPLERAARAVSLGQSLDPVVPLEFTVPAKPFGDRLLHERPEFSADLDGSVHQLEVVAEAPLQTGRWSRRHGVTLRVGEYLIDPMTGVLSVTVGEAEPRFALDLPNEIVGRKDERGVPAFYFLVDRAAGRCLAADVIRFGELLQVASLSYSHATLRFPLQSRKWTGGPPPDFRAWLEHAVLVKVIARPAGSFHSAIAPFRFEPSPTGIAGRRVTGESQP